MAKRTWPRIERCPRCGARIVKARKGRGPGRPNTLELPELLPTKRGRHRGKPGRAGERLRESFVLVNWKSGFARPFDGQQRAGEAAHRRHRCEAGA